MTIPSWVFSRPAIIVAAALIIASGGALWFRDHDAQVRRVTLAMERTRTIEIAKAQLDTTIRKMKESSHAAEGKTDTVKIHVKDAASSYAKDRAKIDTAAAAQPAGIPPGSVVVPVSLLVKADSLVALVPTLLDRLTEERTANHALLQAKDSAISLRDEHILQLEILNKAVKPSKSSRIKDIAIGIVVGVAGYEAVKH